MRKFLAREIAEFKKLSPNARDLLRSFLLFEMFTAISDIFAGAYIFQKQESVYAVALYYLANFITIPIFFYVNGYLLKRVSVLRLFLLGSVLQALSPLILVIIPTVTPLALVILGVIFGMGMAFYWANRNYLTLDSTTDADRNHFFGIASSMGTLSAITAPLLAGYLIAFGTDIFDSKQTGYIMAMGVAFVLIMCAVWILRDNKFHKPQINTLFIVKPQRKWKLIGFATALNNMRQGLMLFFPSMIILLLVGDEAKLGTINAVVSVIAAIFTYTLGRKIKAEGRLFIYTIAFLIFAVGSISLAVSFSALGVIIFLISLRLANPNFFAAISGIWFKYINKLKREDESNYTYLCSLEVYIAIGRLVGIFTFLTLVRLFGQENGLRFIALIFPISQVIIVLILRRLEKS